MSHYGYYKRGIFRQNFVRGKSKIVQLWLEVGCFMSQDSDSLQVLKKDSRVRAKAAQCIERSLEYFSRKRKLILIT